MLPLGPYLSRDGRWSSVNDTSPSFGPPQRAGAPVGICMRVRRGYDDDTPPARAWTPAQAA